MRRGGPFPSSFRSLSPRPPLSLSLSLSLSRRHTAVCVRFFLRFHGPFSYAFPLCSSFHCARPASQRRPKLIREGLPNGIYENQSSFPAPLLTSSLSLCSFRSLLSCSFLCVVSRFHRAARGLELPSRISRITVGKMSNDERDFLLRGKFLVLKKQFLKFRFDRNSTVRYASMKSY